MPENIHDKGYKRILSKKINFLSFLKDFVSDRWVENLSEDSIELVDKEFVSGDFKETEADIVYRLTMGEESVYFYILLELQSTVNFSMPFRLLNYMVEIMKRDFLNTDKNARESTEYRLPTVVPIVIYNGTGEWTALRTFKEYQSNYQAFGNNIIDFSYKLIAINDISDENLMEIGSMVSCFFALDKSMEMYHVGQKFNRLIKIFQKLSPDEQADLSKWVSDVLIKKFPFNKDVINLDTILKEGDPEMMAYNLERTLDMLVEEGIEKGIEKGIIQTAKLMLENNYGTDEIIKITKLPREIIFKLKDELNN